MDMIWHDFHRKNQPIVLGANLAYQFLEPRFHLTNENFPPVSRTEYEMIVNERYGCFRMTIFLSHTIIVSVQCINCNALHPTPKGVGFRAGFL